MNPELTEYLENVRDEYLSKPQNESSYSSDKIVELFKASKKILHKLEKIRANESATKVLIKEALSGYWDIDKQLLEVWLLQVTEIDETYVHAYNFLAQKTNRDMGIVVSKIRDISRIELMRLLKLEKVNNEKQASHLSLTNEIPVAQENQEKKKHKRELQKHQCLFDIWVDCVDKQKSYDDIINKLKQINPFIDTTFITGEGGKLIWNESLRGNRQYLAAFVYTITKGKWITRWYSSRIYKTILENTFEFENGFSPEPFKSLGSKPFEDKYLDPFKGFPVNIKKI